MTCHVSNVPYWLLVIDVKISDGLFAHICEAIRQLSIMFPTTGFLFPVHHNPNVRDVVHAALR